MTNAVLEPKKSAVKFASDPLFSFIVPVYDKDPMVLKRCLMSLIDQDYENKEIICVFDGQNKALMNVASQFLYKGYFKIYEIEHKGACAARNEGFAHSKGDIVSFFNSDYIAKPGMLRGWVDKLQENPDCGFVYGGYEYSLSQRAVFPSGQYDERQLGTENYIDCGFPLWRKYVVQWDEECKSLQDWDFWIRVIKQNGIKGHYLGRDYSFIAEAPKQKGLSDDSSTNWNDRVRYIKDKNGIPMRDILVDSLGAMGHAKEISKIVDGDIREYTWHKTEWIDTYKALYMIGFYISPTEGGLSEHSRRLALFKDKNPKAKRIVHFIGTDIYWLRKFPFESLRYLAGALRLSCDKILSENQAAHDELLEYGIPSEIVPIPSYTSKWEVKSLPKDFKVGIYLVEPGTSDGQSDYDKYCYEHMLSIVRGMPDVQFTAYGKGGWDVEYPNLKHYKTIKKDDWPTYVYDNSALLRICRHDTKPLASSEFMLAGRDVISNIKGECTEYIDTSGNHELNEWDTFSEGFNAYRWPDTKKSIMQKIRYIRDSTSVGGRRQEIARDLKYMQDQEAYKTKIKELCHVD